MTSIPSFNFIPMIIFGNPALAVLVSDKQFEGLCLSLIFNNYDLSHSEQFDLHIRDGDREGKMTEKNAAKLRRHRTKDRIFRRIPHFLRRAQKLE